MIGESCWSHVPCKRTVFMISTTTDPEGLSRLGCARRVRWCSYCALLEFFWLLADSLSSRPLMPRRCRKHRREARRRVTRCAWRLVLRPLRKTNPDRAKIFAWIALWPSVVSLHWPWSQPHQANVRKLLCVRCSPHLPHILWLSLIKDPSRRPRKSNSEYCQGLPCILKLNEFSVAPSDGRLFRPRLYRAL